MTAAKFGPNTPTHRPRGKTRNTKHEMRKAAARQPGPCCLMPYVVYLYKTFPSGEARRTGAIRTEWWTTPRAQREEEEEEKKLKLKKLQTNLAPRAPRPNTRATEAGRLLTRLDPTKFTSHRLRKPRKTISENVALLYEVLFSDSPNRFSDSVRFPLLFLFRSSHGLGRGRAGGAKLPKTRERERVSCAGGGLRALACAFPPTKLPYSPPFAAQGTHSNAHTSFNSELTAAAVVLSPGQPACLPACLHSTPPTSPLP